MASDRRQFRMATPRPLGRLIEIVEVRRQWQIELLVDELQTIQGSVSNLEVAQ